MLAAAVEDLRRVPGVQVLTLLDEQRRGEGPWPDVAVTRVPPGGEPDAFRAAAADADFALVIAPEFRRLLEERCRWAEEAGCRLLGPTPDAVALTADKLALALHLDRAGVPTPATIPGENALPRFAPPYVLKPRYGAGSQDLFVLGGQPTVSEVFGVLAGLDEMVIQPLVPGLAASVAFLIGPRRTHHLPTTEQFVSVAGNFHYLGGKAPLPKPLAERALRVARQAVAAVRGLAGYVGVDVVLGNDADVAIEINPRLTTSYVGLRALTNDNLMDLLLRLVRGESVAKPRWRAGAVRWTADGHVTTD
jgi:predicted ATP-grasp superfamily ATP-dependent carboligase